MTRKKIQFFIDTNISLTKYCRNILDNYNFNLIFITGHMTLAGINSHLLILATSHFLYPQQAPQQFLVLHLIGVTHIIIPGEYKPFIALSGLGRCGFS